MAMNKAPITPVPRRVTVLGSTGSVGCSTVDLLLRDQESFTVEALTAGSNAALLVKQALGLRPEAQAPGLGQGVFQQHQRAVAVAQVDQDLAQ
ncbi:MAG: hypothetical protein ACK4ZN_11620, partial [Oceanibaculum sp.]